MCITLHSSNLQIQAACFSEMLLSTFHATQTRGPQLDTHHCENFKTFLYINACRFIYYIDEFLKIIPYINNLILIIPYSFYW
jgi:hypothetical protein